MAAPKAIDDTRTTRTPTASAPMTNPSVPTTPEPATDEPHPGAPAVPAPTAAVDPDRRRRRRRWWAIGSVVAVLVVALAGALFVPLPYFLLQPGSVRPAQDALSISGAESFEDDGELLFTTVYVDQATLATLLRGQVDEAVEVRSEEEIYGPEGRDASRRVNQQRMDLSKLVATKVALNYLDIPAEFTADGARVLELSDDSPSRGLLQAGDVITRVDGADVAMPEDIGNAVSDRRPGDVVEVTARRPASGEVEEVVVEVPLGESGEEPGRPVLGVSVDPDAPAIDSPVRVDIDSGEVTGPSAGLAWSLAVIDRLTPGSLTDEGRVAVTGEILADGSVGPVGGVVQKVAAVKRAGVERFLYPADTPEEEQEEMRRLAGDGLELVPVASLGEAVEALAPQGVELPQ
jgi:PDZ domain-containing protein